MKKLSQLPKLPKGMGSYDYKNDKIRYRKTITAYGQTKTLSVTADTIQDVNKLMKQKEEVFLRESKIGLIQSQNKTLEIGMREWLDLYKSEELNQKSFDRIESTFNNHIYATDLGRTVETKITSDMIQRHLKERRNSKTGEILSFSSQKKIYELLSQYFRYKYAREPYLNPMITVSRPKNKDKKIDEELIVWNDEEMLALTKVAFEPFIPGKSGFKHGLAIAFMMWSFIRVGELRGLKWKDINNGVVNINKQYSRVRDRKNGGFMNIEADTKYHSSRKISLTNMAKDCIEEYRKRVGEVSPDDFVLDNGQGRPVAMNTITNTYKAMIEAANLPSNKHVTLHGLRHSGISYLIRHNVPIDVVSKMAGHKSIQITLDTYYSVLEEQKSNAIEEFNKHFTLQL